MKDSHEKLVIGKYSFYVLLLSVYIALYPLGMILYTFMVHTFITSLISLILTIVTHTDELLLVGISKHNLYNGVIDFIQASSE